MKFYCFLERIFYNIDLMNIISYIYKKKQKIQIKDNSINAIMLYKDKNQK